MGLKASVTLTRWPMSSRCVSTELVTDFFVGPLIHTGWCSRTRSDKRLVVRPIYPAPQEHENEYTQKEAADRGTISLCCKLIAGVDVNKIRRFAAPYAWWTAFESFLSVRRDTESSLKGKEMYTFFFSTVGTCTLGGFICNFFCINLSG